MKKNFVKYAALAASIFSISAFVGCSADEEDEDPQNLTIKSIRLYDRYGRQICELSEEEMEAWEGQQEPTADYWYEIRYEETGKICSGHFTSQK